MAGVERTWRKLACRFTGFCWDLQHYVSTKIEYLWWELYIQRRKLNWKADSWADSLPFVSGVRFEWKLSYDKSHFVTSLGVSRTLKPSRGRNTSSPMSTRSSRLSKDSIWKFLSTFARTTFSSITAYFWPERYKQFRLSYLNTRHTGKCRVF